MINTDKRLHLIALVVAGAFFMQNLDSAIINTSLPQMAATFGVRALELSAGITSYVIATAACMPLAGWAADRYGARRVFSGAIVVFTVASIACGAATSLTQFVGARVVQGAGGALMAPVGRAVVLKHTARGGLMRAIALITWPALLAPVIAPVLGGAVTTYMSWRWNFLLNVPLGLVAVLLVRVFIPNDKPAHPRPIDLAGLALSSTTLVSLLYSIESLAGERTQWPLSLALTAVGLSCGALTWRHLRRTRHPLLDLSSLSVPSFAICNVGAGLVFRITIAATPFLLPLLFQLGFGLSPLASGWLVMAYFIGNVAMKPATTRLLRRFGFRRVLVVNGLVSGVSILACGWLQPDPALIWPLALLFITGLARSMQFTCLNTLGFADLSTSQNTAASALASMLVAIAMAAGVGLGALVLHASPLLHGRTALALSDYRLAFVIVGLLGIVSTLRFLQLPAGAGAEVSGHAHGRSGGAQ